MPSFKRIVRRGEAGIQVAIEGEPADGAAVPPTGGSLGPLDMGHRCALGRPGNRDRPGVTEEAVQCIELRSEQALDVIDRVNEPGVLLDLPPPD